MRKMRVKRGKRWYRIQNLNCWLIRILLLLISYFLFPAFHSFSFPPSSLLIVPPGFYTSFLPSGHIVCIAINLSLFLHICNLSSSFILSPLFSNFQLLLFFDISEDDKKAKKGMRVGYYQISNRGLVRYCFIPKALLRSTSFNFDEVFFALNLKTPVRCSQFEKKLNQFW